MDLWQRAFGGRPDQQETKDVRNKRSCRVNNMPHCFAMQTRTRGTSRDSYLTHSNQSGALLPEKFEIPAAANRSRIGCTLHTD